MFYLYCDEDQFLKHPWMDEDEWRVVHITTELPDGTIVKRKAIELTGDHIIYFGGNSLQILEVSSDTL